MKQFELSLDEEKSTEKQSKFDSKTKEISEIKDSESAINEMSMSALFSLFHLAHGPLLPLIQKMSKYSSFGQFLADGDNCKISEFIPELSMELRKKN